MTKSTITRGRLLEIIVTGPEASGAEQNELARMALAALDSEPVVPDEKPMPNSLSMYAVDAVAAIAEVRGWNACRAAMLQELKKVQELEQYAGVATMRRC